MKLPSLFLTAALFAVAGSARAGEIQPYSDQTFAALSTAGKPVMIEAHADWCPTCRRQAPVIIKLMASPTYADYTVLKIDYDHQTAVLKRFRITQQSTLISFHGGDERDRAVGITDPESIRAVLDAGLK